MTAAPKLPPNTFRAVCGCTWWIVPETLRGAKPKRCRHCGARIVPIQKSDYRAARLDEPEPTYPTSLGGPTHLARPADPEPDPEDNDEQLW